MNKNKLDLATWMGYNTIEEMDKDHDDLHTRLCEAFDVPSYSMIIANGGTLPHDEYCLANYEEDAVLHVQRWLQMIRRDRIR